MFSMSVMSLLSSCVICIHSCLRSVFCQDLCYNVNTYLEAFQVENQIAFKVFSDTKKLEHGSPFYKGKGKLAESMR